MMRNMRHIGLVGAAVMALAVTSVSLPSIADAKGSDHGGGHGGGHFAGGHGGGRGFGGGGRHFGGGGPRFVGGYGYRPYCSPLRLAAGLCGRRYGY